MRPVLAIAAVCVAIAAAGGSAAVAGVVGPAVSAWVAAGAGIALVAAVIAGSASPGLQLYGPAEIRGAGVRPEVALTFDDGPDPRSTAAIVDALHAGGARATFFLLVDRAEANPELARRIAAGHEVALHGVAHDPWLTVRAPADGERELRDGMRRLEAVTGVAPRRFRPPFGAVSPRLVDAVARAGLALCWASVRTWDGGRAGPEQILARCARARAGDIVMLHEGDRPTRELVPRILADLRARGLRSVTVAELLA